MAGKMRMPATFNYPAGIERDEDGRHVVTFPDFGWGASDGASRAEALAEARDLLRELIATTMHEGMREGRALPRPSPCHSPGTAQRRSLVAPPVQIALKAAFYQAWRQTGPDRPRPACRSAAWHVSWASPKAKRGAC